MDLEAALTSRDQINGGLRGVLDEATGKWGVRVNRVEIKAIDPPDSIKESMEQQMRADRNKRAAILTAEGVKQSAILTAEGEKQSAILTAQGAREAEILRAEGQAKAIDTVFARDPRRQPGPAAAGLPVPRGAAQGRVVRQHGDRRPERADDRDAEDHRGLHQVRRSSRAGSVRRRWRADTWLVGRLADWA